MNQGQISLKMSEWKHQNKAFAAFYKFALRWKKIRFLVTSCFRPKMPPFENAPFNNIFYYWKYPSKIGDPKIGQPNTLRFENFEDFDMFCYLLLRSRPVTKKTLIVSNHLLVVNN